MLRRFLNLFDRQGEPRGPAGQVPAGQRIYAIGDIHGRCDLLDELLARIAADDAARTPAERVLVFLGDLVDRGPQSAQVIDRLIELSRMEPQTRFIMGNHEEVMLKAYAAEKGAMPFFLKIGGRETVLSYGVTLAEYDEAGFPEMSAIMARAVPRAHIDFLSRFEDMVQFGDYAFVHAGVKPGVPLAQQTPESLRWIRQGFLDHPDTLEKVIVHGHTISETVTETACRIGIDTGAYRTGRLTAMGFEGDTRWIVQTEMNATEQSTLRAVA